MSQTIQVLLPQGNYPIHLGHKIIQVRLAEIGNRFSGKPICIVSDTRVYSLYGSEIEKILPATGCKQVPPFLIPPGESSKTLSRLQKCLRHFADNAISRDGLIVTFGGGVAGDLGGFAAGVYMRGIPYIQIPTSLLAQLDASIGGKTAVNLPQGKNLAGVFHQPLAVVSDCSFLKTLSLRHLRNGLAEAIKTAIIGDPSLFKLIENSREILLNQPNSTEMQDVIARSVMFKAAIVAVDEKERSVRAHLNFGHTIGHAIERYYNYKNILHGEAVALGIIVETEIASQMGLIKESESARICELLAGSGYRTHLNDSDDLEDTIVRIIKLDKKVKDGRTRFILPVCIGSVIIYESIPDHLIKKSIRVSMKR